MGLMYKREMKHDGKKYPINVEYYNSANELVDDLRVRKLRSGGWHEPKEDADWTGCKNIDEAYELLRTGYAPVVEKLEREYKIGCKQNGSSTRFSFKNNICGYAPVVPLAMQGVPNSMVSMTMKPIKAKVIDIYYDMTCNCGVTWTDIIETGKNILATVLDLEKQGYRFNLFAVQTYSDEDDCDMLIVKVKDAKRPLDLRRMSFPLCHTGFFRLIGFDWYGKNPDSRYRWSYGHNISQELNHCGELPEFVRTTCGDNAIMLCANLLVNKAKSTQKEYIKEVLLNGNQSKEAS